MFQPSHFQKMAQHLGVDSLTYEKEYNAFMTKLKNFHESKGTPFRRLPWLGGQYLDLYLLYRKVTLAGGWVKVTEGKTWRDIAEVFNLPPTCTNAAFALRQHYSRYLESFERINFFGEDAEDVLSAGRPHTPVGGGSFSTHIPTVAAADYVSVISTSKDPSRNFDKLVLSLQCGMPNEVDFAINICMLLSNVSNSVFNLSKAPAVIDTLLAHTGIFSEDSHGLKELYEDWYLKQHMERDFVKFWKDNLKVEGVQEILCSKNDEGPNASDVEALFHPVRRKVGAKDVECQRISQVGMILYNFSFDDTNASVLASHPLCLRFLIQCICSEHGFLQRMAWETLANLAEKMLLEPIESSNTQMFFQMLHFFLDHKDRYHVTNAMDVLGKLCTLEGNDEVIEGGLEPEAYQSLIKVLIVSDVQLVLSSLESLYNLSGVGQVTSDHIAEVHHSIDVLVCLVTMDAECFGPEALSEVQILEKRVPAAVQPAMQAATPSPATPKPQSSPMPVVPQQPKEPVVQHQAPPSSPSPGPIRSPSPSPVPIKTTGTEIEPETFTYNWLQGTYESCPGSSVSRIDIYADYLSSCSKLARIGILNATAFNRIIKLAFPDGQLRRVQSGDNAQYVLAGIKRRANPLPVETRTDSPATARQPSAASPHSAGHRVSPGQQSISRTPTLPVQSQLQPAWNPREQNAVAAQPTPVQSMTRTFEQRPLQFPGGSQQQQQQQPGMVRVPRRPSFSNQGNMPTIPDQGIRQYPAATIQQQVSQTATDCRQMMAGQMQRTIAPTGNEQPLERITAMRRASVEGLNSLPGQGTQSIQYQSQGQAVQRTSLPPPSPGPLREGKQQTTYPAQGIQPQTVPMLPGQRMAVPGAQLMAKQSQGGTVGMTGNSRPPQSPLSRSPLVPPRPIQPSTAQPAQTTPPTSSVRRPSLAAEPPAGYQQSLPPYPQQHNIRPAPPAYNSRPTYYGNYPPLAPKPAPEMTVQLSQQYQARKQIPPDTIAIGRHARPVPSSPLQQSDAGKQNFQPQVPPLNIARSPLVPSNLASGQPFSRSKQDVHGGFTQTAVGQDSRQSTRRPEGVVLIAQEERAADVVSSGLLDGAEEQQIVVVENKNRTNHSVYSENARIAHDIPTNQVDIAQHSRGELFASNAGNPQKPQGSHPSSNGSLKRDLNAHMTHDTVEENLNGRRDNSIGGDCGPAKRPRLEKRMSSLENELDNSTSVPSRTSSPTHLVNGDIKGDPRSKLMDKLLDKDLRLPLNGVCGIDASDLDLLASDGERLSGSKASSPDLFGSETNSDFGKYLEESDTDTGLFSDVLQGDLRIDPMENGTEGTHPVQSSKMPTFTETPFHDSGNVLNVKGASSAVTPEQQGKIPIPPSVGSDTQRLHEGAVNVAISRNPSAVNSTWNATNTVSQTSKLGYVNQRLAPDVQQRLPGYSQQGLAPQHVGIRLHLDNMSSTESQGTTVASQKRVFQHQNIQSNPQRVRTAQDPPAVMNRSGVLQNTLLGSHGPSTVNSIAPGIQGSGVQQPLSVRPPFQGAPSIQTSLPRVNADSSGGIQSVAWAQTGVQQQLGLVERNQQRVGQVVLQQNAVAGAQVPSGPPNVSLPSGYQQKTVNVYPDIGTQISASPASVMYDTTSASQSRQQPSQYQQTVQPGVQNPVAAASNPVIAGSQEFPSTPPAKGHLSDSVVPPVMSFKPYRCRWATCFSSFDTSKDLFSHVVKEHVPRDSLVLSCMWEGCPPVRRSRSSLLFHLQQKHSEPSPVPSTLPLQAAPAQHQPPPVQPPPQPQAPPPNQKTTFVPAYHFLARMLQSFQGEEETPLTKTVRLTAALVLRNVAQYSALARSMLRRHESHLSIVAMSNSEAAHAVAACLSELSPHRKASSSDSNTFIWALER